MTYFIWADDMAIDHGPIDRDHQRLVALVNDLHSATRLGEGRQVVGGILDELIAYTGDHLQREEALMAAVDFPELERHKLGHAEFVAGLRTLQDKFAAGSMATAAQLSTLLRDWLSLHIRRSDKALRAFLESDR